MARVLPLIFYTLIFYNMLIVKMKNVYYKKIKDEVTGNEIRSIETKEIIDDHREKFEKKPFPWRIMKKFMNDNNVDVLAYDGSHKAYSRGDSGIDEGREYFVKVKRDCEQDDPDADRCVLLCLMLNSRKIAYLSLILSIHIFNIQ